MIDPKEGLVMEAVGIDKIYPGTRALNSVDFRIYKGKVNVLVGENGAGKSTLMKIVAGIEQPTKGELIMYAENGKPEVVAFSSTRDAVQKGIGIVHQELNLFSDMDVAENIFMNKELKKNAVAIDHAAQKERAVKVLKRLGQDIEPDTLIRDLRLGQQQIVEIAKTMIDEPKILIMDEPTSSLSIQEVKVLFRVIADLKAQGVAIIYISHRLEEIKEIGDYITILRDARLIDFDEIEKLDMPDIIEKMVGRDPKQFFKGEAHDTGDVLLRVEGMTLPRFGGGYTLDHVSFELREGEVLGIYGLMGAGRTELMESLMGNMDKASGSIWLGDEKIDHLDTKERIERGLVLIPEERQREGLFLNLDVEQNLTMSSLSSFTKVFHLDKAEENRTVLDIIKQIAIKVASPQISINALSGGNQQKVVIGKGLLTKPRVLLMDEPTRGIDVGAKSDVFEITNRMANEKFGIVLVSSELEEIFSMSDRIIVLSKGKVTGVFSRTEATEEKVRKASEIGHGISASAQV